MVPIAAAKTVLVHCCKLGIVVCGRRERCRARTTLTTRWMSIDMAKLPLLTPAQLRNVVSYDADMGLFLWRDYDCAAADEIGANKRQRSSWTKRAGTPALRAPRGGGYVGGHIFERGYLAHRAAWAYVHGEWPDQCDHINHNRSDNRIQNLRDVSRSENARNLRYKNIGCVLGVWMIKRTGMWTAQIGVSGRQVHLGNYTTHAEAVAARRAAEKICGYHANHGT